MPRNVALALPSLRPETLTKRLMEEIRRVRKTSFTLAPEAGTQHMRNIINKGDPESDLLATTREVFEAGWKAVKLYFMIGLPFETEEDIEGIVELSHRVLRRGAGAGDRSQPTSPHLCLGRTRLSGGIARSAWKRRSTNRCSSRSA